MASEEDLLGVGVNLDDDGNVVVVLTFDEDAAMSLEPPVAALIGTAIVNAAAHAGRIQIELSETPPDDRLATINRIRERYSAEAN